MGVVKVAFRPGSGRKPLRVAAGAVPLRAMLERHKRYLQHVVLRGQELTHIDLSDGDLSFCDLFQSDLRFAFLRGARLTGANLYQAGLMKADMREADLSAAEFYGNDLLGTDLRGAVLFRSDLEKVWIQRGTDLRGAVYDPMTTKWPPAFDPLNAGARPLLEGHLTAEVLERFRTGHAFMPGARAALIAHVQGCKGCMGQFGEYI